MFKYLFYAALIFVTPFLLMLLIGAGWTSLYLLPIGFAVAAAIVNGRQPSRTP